MVKMIFEDDEAWEQHLNEIEEDKGLAWDEGHLAGLNRASRDEGDLMFGLDNPYRPRVTS